MALEKAPAFQWYPKDYLTDPVTVAMSLEAEGAYRRLMDYCWLEGSLVNDMASLAKLCKSNSVQKFSRLWSQMVGKFELNPEGRWIHPRLERERKNQAESRSRRANSARERWDKAHAAQEQCICNADAMQCSSSSSSSSSSTPVKRDAQTPPPPLDDPTVPTPEREIWEAWREEWEAVYSDVLSLEPRGRDRDNVMLAAKKDRPMPWVRLMIRAYLQTRDKAVEESPRTIGWLLRRWSWVEHRLAEKGYTPDKVAA